MIAATRTFYIIRFGKLTILHASLLSSKHWVYNSTAYNNSYTDGGMFCIYGSAPPEYMRSLTEVLIQEFHKMADPLDSEEFDVL